MQLRVWILTAVFIAACGSKAPAPADVAPEPAPAATTGPAADATAPGAPSEDAAPVAVVEDAAPVAVVEDAAPVAVVEDTTVAVVEDTTAAVAEDTTVAVMDDTAPLPADLPKVPGLAPEVVARALSGEEGCVGIAKSGRAVLSIVALQVDDKPQATLLWTDLSRPERAFADQAAWPIEPATLEAEDLRELVKGKNLLPCKTTTGTSMVVPKSVPVTISATDRELSATIDGNRPFVVDVRPDIASYVPVAAYWSEDIGNVFVRVELSGEPRARDSVGLVAVPAAELGQSACVPRPSYPMLAKPLTTTAPPAFNPAPPDVSCVAMTADGQMAAFKTWSINRMPDGGGGAPNAIEWFGTGTAPAIDLSCMARNACKADQKAALAEQATALGLVGCNIAKSGIALDGLLATTMYQGTSYKLKGGSGWRPVYELAHGLDGEGHESLWKVFQHPAGGPVFLYVGNQDTGVEEVLVKVLDEAAMKLCPKAPAGTLAISEVKASSAAGDGGGYKFGAAQLADNDLTTSWQPAASKGNEAPWVELALDGEHEVVAVEIANGFQRKDGSGDMFALNARAATATLSFSDGSSQAVSFAPDARGLVRFDVAPRKTTRVRVTIDSLHDGARWPKDVALSEVRVMGPATP